MEDCYFFVKLQAFSTPPWVLFTFFKLYKWYQIAQRIANAILGTIGRDWETSNQGYALPTQDLRYKLWMHVDNLLLLSFVFLQFYQSLTHHRTKLTQTTSSTREVHFQIKSIYSQTQELIKKMIKIYFNLISNFGNFQNL